MGEWACLGIRGFQGKAGRRNHFIFIDFFKNAGRSDENPADKNMIPPKMITDCHIYYHCGNHTIFILSDFLIIYILRNGWISAKGNISRIIRMESFKWGI